MRVNGEYPKMCNILKTADRKAIQMKISDFQMFSFPKWYSVHTFKLISTNLYGKKN